MMNKEDLYRQLFDRLSSYVFTGYSDEVTFREVRDWEIEVYICPAYPVEELTEEDCYYGTIYIEDDGFHWEDELLTDVDELFLNFGLL